MGVDITGPSWARNKGLRIVADGRTYELPWPELERFPNFGLVCARTKLDGILVRHAEGAGARLQEGMKVLEPILEERTRRVCGVRVQPLDERGRPTGPRVALRAPIVVAADGVSARMAVALGRERLPNRPMGVAVRAYAPSPRAGEPWMESHLELRSEGALLPGYGWVFGLADGTVNIGLGILNTSKAFQNVDYRDLLRRWMRETPSHWALRGVADDVTIKGLALPMGFNRQPHYARGLLLVGDSGGMVNPFNGEGIDYALEAGTLAGERIHEALSHTRAEPRETALFAYSSDMKQRYGGYYTLGRWFVRAIGHPKVMGLATRRGMPVPVLRQLALKMMANLTDLDEPDVLDAVVNTLSRIAPAA
jgi:geranylgeranyl reductase family protein